VIRMVDEEHAGPCSRARTRPASVVDGSSRRWCRFTEIARTNEARRNGSRCGSARTRLARWRSPMALRRRSASRLRERSTLTTRPGARAAARRRATGPVPVPRPRIRVLGRGSSRSNSASTGGDVERSAFERSGCSSGSFGGRARGLGQAGSNLGLWPSPVAVGGGPRDRGGPRRGACTRCLRRALRVRGAGGRSLAPRSRRGFGRFRARLLGLLHALAVRGPRVRTGCRWSWGVLAPRPRG